ncbi:MAG: hypothetical protein AAGA10_29550 [Bacteroidota bacterium]
MDTADLSTIVKYAWLAYDSSRPIQSILDISARVSTNHVFRVRFKDRSFVIAKLSYFGKFEHFVEDHTIVNVLGNNLLKPYDNFLATSLMKGKEIFFHRFSNGIIDAWVVFYRPVKIKNKLPRRLEERHIDVLAEQMAGFHKACQTISHTLPPSSQTLKGEICHLQSLLKRSEGKRMFGRFVPAIQDQCSRFLENWEKLNGDSFARIPVFVDWNIGNFSVTPSFKLYSRWDYDWFRVSTRMMDMYFLSRIVSDVGDKTIFSYNISTFMEDRFIRFLSTYHQINPLSKEELLVLREGYRFFILHYVVKHGKYFFAESYAEKLQKEAFEVYFPSIDKEFHPDTLISALGI